MRRLITLSAPKRLAAAYPLVEFRKGLLPALQTRLFFRNWPAASPPQCSAVCRRLYPSTFTCGRSPRVSASFTSVRIVCDSPGINAM